MNAKHAPFGPSSAACWAACPAEPMKTASVVAANAHLEKAGLPSYSQLLTALRNLEWACKGVPYIVDVYGDELSSARELLDRAGGRK